MPSDVEVRAKLSRYPILAPFANHAELVKPPLPPTRSIPQDGYTTKRRRLEHIPALDGIRGVAILLVVAIHSAQAANRPSIEPAWADAVVGAAKYGWIGVDLFFVLSGFLITRILLDSNGHPHHFRNFYARRTLRIFPLYFVVILLRFLLPWPTLPAINPSGHWCAALYLSNVWQVFAPIVQRRDAFLGVTWSLAVEEQFYLFWPLVVWIIPRRFVVPTCMVIVAIAVGCRWGCYCVGVDPWAAYVLTPCRLDAFAAGAAVAAMVRLYGAPRLLPIARAAGIVSVLALAALLWCQDDDSAKPMALWGHLLLAILFAALIVWALAGRYVPQLAAAGWLRSAGKYSYGIYLFHNPVLRLGVTPLIPAGWSNLTSAAMILAVGLPVTFGLAWLSSHLFEQPILRLKQFFPR
jgi:peptidoglycan/LPS O-acetylase OafA/YrhL